MSSALDDARHVAEGAQAFARPITSTDLTRRPCSKRIGRSEPPATARAGVEQPGDPNMFPSRSNTIPSVVSVALVAMAAAVSGRARADEAYPPLRERDLSGPRFGVTYRPNDSGSSNKDVGHFVSQFGWHFETQVVPRGGGPQFIIQFVPLVAGVEYGKALPSGSLGMGVRFPSGYEFGLGPTVAAAGSDFHSLEAKSALFVAVGRSFDYGGVSIPFNLVFVTNQDGQRVSLIAGYAIRRSSRPLEPEPTPER